MNGDRPSWKQRAGTITCTIGLNKVQSRNGEREIELPSIVLEKSYKGKDGKWGSTNRFNLEDLSRVRLLAEAAFAYLVTKEVSEAGTAEVPGQAASSASGPDGRSA